MVTHTHTHTHIHTHTHTHTTTTITLAAHAHRGLIMQAHISVTLAGHLQTQHHRNYRFIQYIVLTAVLCMLQVWCWLPPHNGEGASLQRWPHDRPHHQNRARGSAGFRRQCRALLQAPVHLHPALPRATGLIGT